MKHFVLAFGLLLGFNAFSQSQGQFSTAQEGNVWYFGTGAGLDFNSGTPVPLSNNGYSTTSQEGAAVACDANGDILFYTDGTDIYDMTHNIMSNGAGINGHYSTTQSAQIFPMPGSTTEYYVFHLEDKYSPDPSRNGELYYSIVDITANGGLGAVTTKNILMHGGIAHMEGMDVVYHANDTDIWLITHGIGNDVFYIDLITSTGITNSTQSIGANTSTAGGLGMYRFSPDGSLFAFINNGQDRAEIFSFDDANGTLSNRKKVNTWSSYTAYGVAFSADGTKLYVSGNNANGNIYGRLYQYDVTAGTAANIQATETLISSGTGPFTRYSGLRLGPDDKIYLTHFLSGNGSLSVINSPNNAGSGCGFSQYSLNLGNETGRNVPEYFIPLTTCPISITSSATTDENCSNADGSITVVATPSPLTYTLHDAGNGSSITSNSTGIFNNLSNGDYYVVVDDGSCSDSTNTLTINTVGNLPDPGIGDTVYYCPGDATFDLFNTLSGTPETGGSWTPVLGSGSGVFDPALDVAGSYTYTVTNTCGSSTTDVEVIENPLVNADITTVGSFCESSAATTLTAATTGGTWSGPGITNASTGDWDPATAGAGTHTIIYTISGACGNSDTITITVDPLDNSTFSYSNNTYCENDPNPTPTVSGATGGTFTIDNGGTIDPASGEVDLSSSGANTYIITYTTNGTCPTSTNDTINIVTNDNASFTYSDSVYCVSEANPIASITGTTGGAFSISSGGSIDPNSGEIDLSTTPPGMYTVTYQTTGQCSDVQTYDLFIIDQVDASITPAGPFCENSPSTLLVSSPVGGSWSGPGVDPATGEFSPNTAGVGIHEIIYSVTGSCGDSDTIYIEVNSTPTADAGLDQYISYGETANLNGTGGTTYSWSPSSSLSCSNCPSPIASPLNSTTYELLVTDTNGCSSADSVTVFVADPYGELFIPNTFSPNGDQQNDVFYVYGFGLQEFELHIFNRWGEVVYYSTVQSEGWDGYYQGEALNTAVFTYMVSYLDGNGNTQVLSGNLTLLK